MNISSELIPDEKWMPVKAFMEKPFKPDVLLSKIKEVLNLNEFTKKANE